MENGPTIECCVLTGQIDNNKYTKIHKTVANREFTFAKNEVAVHDHELLAS